MIRVPKVRIGWQAAILGCAGLCSLVVTASAAAATTGSVVVVIHPGSPAPAVARVAPPAYVQATRQVATASVAPRSVSAPRASSASTPGNAVTLSLIIKATSLGLQAMIAGDWTGLLPIWHSAGAKYGIPWEVLAAINKIESNDGTNLGPSSAGAVGWMQFMPATWAYYGDALSGGVADPNNPLDAITSAAYYLAASGGRSNLPRAIYAYNHAWWYVDEVLTLARSYGYLGTVPVSATRATTG